MHPILTDLPELIETTRLFLRPPQAGDGPILFEAITESLPELCAFAASLPWVTEQHTLQSAEVFCRTARANFSARRDLPFLIFNKSDNRLVGTARLHRIVWTTPKAEMGYWCRTSSSGNGYITEAVDALAKYCFDQMNAVRLELLIDEENIKSRRIAERCNFLLEGTLRNERKAPNSSLRNTCIYARLPQDGISRWCSADGTG